MQPLPGVVLSEILGNAMSCVTDIMDFVSKDELLSVLAFGFVLACGGIRVIKRLTRIGG